MRHSAPPFVFEALQRLLRGISGNFESTAMLAFSPILYGLLYSVIEPLLDNGQQTAETSPNNASEELQASLDQLKQLAHRTGVEIPVETAKLFSDGIVRHRQMRMETIIKELEQSIAAIERAYGYATPRPPTPGQELLALLGHSESGPGPVSGCFDLGLLMSLMPEIRMLAAMYVSQHRDRQLGWQTILDADRAAVAYLLSPANPWAQSSLLQLDPASGKIAVPAFWVNLAIRGFPADRAVWDDFIVPLSSAQLEAKGASLGRLDAADLNIIRGLLASDAGLAGASVLVHGQGTDKVSVIEQVLRECGRPSYCLNLKEVPAPQKASICALSVAHLDKTRPGAPLIIPDAVDVLGTRHRLFFGMFGMDDPDSPSEEPRLLKASETAPLVDIPNLLVTAPQPLFWLCGDPSAIPVSTASRFLLHAEVKRASRKERRVLLEDVIGELNIPKEYKEQLLSYEGLSISQLESGLKLAGALTPAHGKFWDVLKHAIDRSQRVLHKSRGEHLNKTVTKYSLDLLNTSGRFTPADILSALRKTNSASICFYGLPGTGKTQLAEHYALELEQPLVRKRASDIFGKYLGESEKAIRDMFEEATEEGAILFLDEADTFLRDRSRAEHQWEVSITNELLQRMEAFKGIFICATNLMRGLDAASLRRFMFKVEFMPLEAEQRWRMLEQESGADFSQLDLGTLDELLTRLTLIANLTPGDFATVQRQCKLFDKKLSLPEWLEQLEIEARIKLGNA